MTEQLPQDDDVQGHMSPRPTGAPDLTTDDVEGRRFPADSAAQQSRADNPADDEDDVSGHAVRLRPTDPKR
jgi:hypothetical protein